MRSASLLFLLALPCLFGCPPKRAPKRALPGCEAAQPTESRAEREAVASRSLAAGDPEAAAQALRQAACHDGPTDALLAERVARALLSSSLALPAQRLVAAEILLGTKTGPSEVRALAGALPEGPEALALWIALAEQGDNDALLFIGHTAPTDPAARAAILRVLGLRGQLSGDEIATALADPSEALRAAAVDLAARQAPLLLEAAAADPAPAVRREVAYRLSALPPELGAALAGLLQTDPDPGVRLSALEAALALGVARQETLSLALTGDDPLLAISAARLAGPKDPAARARLAAELKAPGPARQSAILAASGFIEAAETFAPLLQTLTRTGTPDEQVLAAAGLLRLSLALPSGKSFREADEDAQTTLQQRCEEEGRPAVRACSELAPRGDAAALQKLRRAALADPDPSARAAALRSLALRGTESLSILAAALADPDPEVRLVAARLVLRAIGAAPKPRAR